MGKVCQFGPDRGDRSMDGTGGIDFILAIVLVTVNIYDTLIY